MPTPIDCDRLLQRFLRYVRIGTSANPHSDTYPSSIEQMQLSRLLTDELVAMGIDSAHMDDHGLVWATIPASEGKSGAPVIALNAHVDTSPEAPGNHVHAQVITYSGGDIPLAAEGEEIRVSDCEELDQLVGKTLITSDGTTLLGGDDKAGIAIIMELAETLTENPSIPHGAVEVLFTCDEEIGHGTDKIDLDKLNAIAAYTLDGGGAGDLDVETFSADAATVRIVGRNIHPSIGKGRMVNALRAAAHFVGLLPVDELSPETTDGRQGFIHPHEISGGVGEAVVHLILRSFDTAVLGQYASRIEGAAQATEAQFPGASVQVEIHKQYRNMAEGLRSHPRVADLAEQAFQNLKRPVRRNIIRGGTDGSALTEKGLPTPNLSSGQHAIHSLHEFACLEEMIEAVEHLEELLKLWSEQ